MRGYDLSFDSSNSTGFIHSGFVVLINLGCTALFSVKTRYSAKQGATNPRNGTTPTETILILRYSDQVWEWWCDCDGH